VKEIMKSLSIGFIAVLAVMFIIGSAVLYTSVQFVLGFCVFSTICWFIGEVIRNLAKTNYKGPK